MNLAIAKFGGLLHQINKVLVIKHVARN
jgi:hypothetical protein